MRGTRTFESIEPHPAPGEQFSSPNPSISILPVGRLQRSRLAERVPASRANPVRVHAFEWNYFMVSAAGINGTEE